MKSLINAQHLRLYHDPRPLRRQEELVENQVGQVTDESEPEQETQEIGNDQTLPESDIPTQADDTTYEVERLLGKKLINGKLHYKCKWTDGSPPSWEPVENIAEDLVEDFHVTFTQKGTRRKKRKRQNYKYFNRT